MAAKLQRTTGFYVKRLAGKTTGDFRPRPQQAVDFVALCRDIKKRFPKVLKRLAE